MKNNYIFQMKILVKKVYCFTFLQSFYIYTYVFIFTNCVTNNFLNIKRTFVYFCYSFICFTFLFLLTSILL